MRAWLARHGFDANHVYRVDINGLSITVHQYDSNDDGRHYVVEGEVAVKTPVVVAFLNDPPSWM